MKKGLVENIAHLVMYGLFASFVAMFPALTLEWLLSSTWGIEFNTKYLIILGFGFGIGFYFGETSERNSREGLIIKDTLDRRNRGLPYEPLYRENGSD
jgi:hypothetical protein